MDKLIITVAPTGNVPTKALNPHVPISVAEIVADIGRCVAFGASIAHIHVRDHAQNPTNARSVFQQVLTGLDEQGTTVIRQLSTGVRGGANTVEARGQMLDLPVEMASLATGSSNFAKGINANSFALIEALALRMKEQGIKPEIEVFDAAMIANACFLLDRGILQGPLHFNLVLGVPGSLPGTPRNLLFLLDSLPPEATWKVTPVGKCHVSLLTLAVGLGGHVRVGLEDVLDYGHGLAASNLMLVKRAVSIARILGREIATYDEAKALLRL